jgi:NAD(P)-dependent dehydrogenase (short-subunit alcohol dehydrogenase family)
VSGLRVLLFGGTGAVGRGCLDVLARDRDMSLVIAGRDRARLREAASAARADIEVSRIDLVDRAAVASAVKDADVVVNCAGPSHQLSGEVAGAAIAAGVPYVDPGGDHTLLDRLTGLEPAKPVVPQAGVQPGLSGLLLRVLATHRSGPIDDVTAWSGGLQRLTSAAVLEYLASLHDPHSHPGSALRDGQIRRVTHEQRKEPPPQYFSDAVALRPHLDAETVAVAAHIGIGNVLWMNVFDGAHTTRAMQLLAVGDHGHTDPGEVLAAAKLDLFGRRPYFAIVGEARGSGGITTVAFTCPDSYRVTGALAAFAALHITGMSSGVHPFWSVDEPQRVLDFLTDAVPDARVSVADDSMVEEGSL